MINTKQLNFTVTYERDENFDHERFMKLRLKVLHAEENLNQSDILLTAIEAAQPSIYNTPILGNVVFDDDNKPDFNGHDMHIEEDPNDEDSFKLIYDELIIGIIPNDCNYEVKVVDGLPYVFVDAYIHRGYSNWAEDIIERDKRIKLSAEILVDDGHWDEANNKLIISKFRYKGVTLLGQVKSTGMKDTFATLEYSETNNINEEMQAAVNEIINSLNNPQPSESGVNIEEYAKREEIILDKGTEFKLNLVEMLEEIEIQVEAEKIKNEWDYEYPRYWTMDVQDEEVIVRDRSDNCRLYGIPVMMDGDLIKLDFENVKRKKTKYEDLVGEEVPVQLFEESLDKIFEDLNSKTKEYSDQLAELTETYETLKSDYENVSEKYSQLVAEIKEAEEAVEMAEKGAVLEDFEKELAEVEEFIKLKETVNEYSLEDLLKECLFISHKTKVKPVAKFTKEDKTVKLPVVDEKVEDYYGGLLSRQSN